MYVSFSRPVTIGQNPVLTEPLFCQGDTSITYNCTVNPTQNPGIVMWLVNGSGLPASFIEGVNTEVGRVLTDPARGLTANVTAYDGETLVTILTIDSSSMLIGTVVACEDVGGNAASTTTDISRKKVMYEHFDIIPTRLLKITYMSTAMLNIVYIYSFTYTVDECSRCYRLGLSTRSAGSNNL